MQTHTYKEIRTLTRLAPVKNGKSTCLAAVKVENLHQGQKDERKLSTSLADVQHFRLLQSSVAHYMYQCVCCILSIAVLTVAVPNPHDPLLMSKMPSMGANTD